MSRDQDTDYVAALLEDKADRELGGEVEAYLRGRKLLPALPGPAQLAAGVRYSPAQAVHNLTVGIKGGLRSLGLDVENDPSLKDTPRRYAKMLVGELTKGLNFDFFPKCTTFPNDGQYNQMVFLGGIQTLSLCEHHLQTIDGFTYIGYLPNERMIGLSKLARVTDFFARRPQVQERMTEQIFAALQFILKTEDVAVVQRCVHYCMKARGSLQHSTSMDTNRMGGRFMTNPSLRQEFLDACRT